MERSAKCTSVASIVRGRGLREWRICRVFQRRAGASKVGPRVAGRGARFEERAAAGGARGAGLLQRAGRLPGFLGALLPGTASNSVTRAVAAPCHPPPTVTTDLTPTTL
eukprot:739309-Lingulodinium_polyedra.AAC.1